MQKSDEIIKRYVKGIVYEENVYTLIYNYDVKNHQELIEKIDYAIKDFLENADIQDSNEVRNKKEFKIFANANGLRNENSQQMFAEALELVLSNRVIKSEYQWGHEKPKNLITK